MLKLNLLNQKIMIFDDSIFYFFDSFRDTILVFPNSLPITHDTSTDAFKLELIRSTAISILNAVCLMFFALLLASSKANLRGLVLN